MKVKLEAHAKLGSLLAQYTINIISYGSSIMPNLLLSNPILNFDHILSRMKVTCTLAYRWSREPDSGSLVNSWIPNVSKLTHIHICPHKCTHHSLSLSSHELLLFSSEGEAWIHLLK